MPVKKIYSFFFLCLPVCFICCDNNQAAKEIPEISITTEEVIAFLKTYDDAWNLKNRSVVDSLYAPQYKYFTSVGGVSSRARNLEILAADYYKLISGSRTELDISVNGNIAIVSSRWQGTGIWKGEPFSDNQRCGLVIQKKGNKLKLLSEHCVDISSDPGF